MYTSDLPAWNFLMFGSRQRSAWMCRILHQVTAVDTHQQLFEVQADGVPQIHTYRMTAARALEQTKNLQWLSTAEVIHGLLGAMIKYSLHSCRSCTVAKIDAVLHGPSCLPACHVVLLTICCVQH